MNLKILSPTRTPSDSVFSWACVPIVLVSIHAAFILWIRAGIQARSQGFEIGLGDAWQPAVDFDPAIALLWLFAAGAELSDDQIATAFLAIGSVQWALIGLGLQKLWNYVPTTPPDTVGDEDESDTQNP